VTLRFRLYLHVDDLEDLSRPRWEPYSGHGKHRELHVGIGDVQLVMSEPVASSLREMLAVIVNPATEIE
jgi:hypothetical protein